MPDAGSATLWETFRARTGGLGDRTAVTGSTADLTFAELWAQSDALARRLRAAGVVEGRPAGVALASDPRFVTVFLALCRLDSTVVLVPPQYRSSELSAVVGGLGLDVIVSSPELASGVVAAVPGAARTSTVDGLAVLATSTSGGTLAEGPTALVKLSSGSTTAPKCIRLDAHNVIAEADNVAATLALGPTDRIVAGVPLFHSYGFDLGVLPTLFAGSCLEIDDVFVPRRTLAGLAERSPTAYLGVPAEYRAMLAAQPATPADLSEVRWLLSCTAPLSADVVIAFAERYHAPICQHYGTSETGAATTHDVEEVLARPASVGRAMSGVEVTVVDPAGTAVPVGAEGEVVVSSAAVARGYALGAPPGRSPFRARGFWTGDLGRLDADGFLTLSGRRDGVINVGGLKVSPEEVAATLERHPAVREAAALGIADGTNENVVWAAVALSSPVDEAELIAFCREALADYKVPRRITIVDSLPRTASGKVSLRREDLLA